MDFGKILNQWEKKKKKKTKSKKRKHPMDSYLDSFSPTEEDFNEKEKQKIDPSLDRKFLLELKPQKTIDLHGMNTKQALFNLNEFIIECKNQNIKKILIIHGKGNHSKGDPILGKKVKIYLEKNSLTGEFDIPDKSDGGSGALWVIIR